MSTTAPGVPKISYVTTLGSNGSGSSANTIGVTMWLSAAKIWRTRSTAKAPTATTAAMRRGIQNRLSVLIIRTPDVGWSAELGSLHRAVPDGTVTVAAAM